LAQFLFGGTVVVADRGGSLAGFCCGQMRIPMCCPYDCAVITELFVEKKFRRRRQAAVDFYGRGIDKTRRRNKRVT